MSVRGERAGGRARNRRPDVHGTFGINHLARKMQQKAAADVGHGISVTAAKPLRAYVTEIDATEANHVFIRRITSIDPLTQGDGPADPFSYPVVTGLMPAVGDLVHGHESNGGVVLFGPVSPGAAASPFAFAPPSGVPSGVPVGAGMSYPLGAPLEDGAWVPKDGRLLEKAQYPELDTLMEAAGYPYGHTETHVAVPDKTPFGDEAEIIRVRP